MAKGRTNQPLNLMVEEGMWGTPEVQALLAQGHNVTILDSIKYQMADGYLGSKMWRMTPELIKYLPMALKAMRKEKREREGKTNRAAGKPKKATRKSKKGSGGDPAASSEPGVPGGLPSGAAVDSQGEREPGRN